MSELGGEKIDIIEWSEAPVNFIEDALSPAKVIEVAIDEDEHKAVVEVSGDQQSLAIGRGGQNVRLAAKLTGWRIDIHSIETEAPQPAETEEVAESDTAEVAGTPEEPAVAEPVAEEDAEDKESPEAVVNEEDAGTKEA
jgi:N utilization substance protein A